MKDQSGNPDVADRRELLREALSALEKMQQKLEAIQRARREAIAVIGMACRLPGGVSTSEDYWELLTQGRDAIRRVPADRWDVSQYYDSDPSAPGKIHAPFGGFLENIDLFDAAFFGISRREAESMDPQQRLLLEVSWEAIERACIDASTLRGSKTGVFVGVTTVDYSRLALDQGRSNLDAYTATGNALNVTAGRLSYTLGLNGPAMAIDTACSSSLVAIHLACQSLRSGESNIALAGGVNVLLSPEPFICFAKWGMMAPDGRCKTFDAAADGFVRGEGCGILVLKRLSDALFEGDPILALLRGSAINQDGASSGLTVPSGRAQEAVISEALKAADIAGHRISYVEAHGTGTSLGDPIELEAIVNVLGARRTSTNPLRVGSVKTNIGHLESASGVAGVMKTILSLNHKVIPPHLHFQKLNPQIHLGDTPIEIPTKLIPWDIQEGPRVAGVSSFGFSGTNAHIIVEEAPEIEKVKEPRSRPSNLFTLSAKTPEALNDLTDRYLNYFNNHPSNSISDICFSTNKGRLHFNYRLAVIGKTAEAIRHGLQSYRKGEEMSSVFHGEVLSRNSPLIAFLFTGQGSQTIGMARMLYETQPTFRQTLEKCNELLANCLEQPLLSVLYPKPGMEQEAQSLLTQTVFTQPALFALEYALAELWRSWGIEPSVVMGHSVGEYVAACVAGVFSLEDGLKLIAERGKLMQSLPKGGAMAAVFADEPKVAETIEGFKDGVSIAAINSPENTVISGVETDLEAVLRRLDNKKIGYQKLQVSHAFHSCLVEPILEKFNNFAAGIQYAKTQKDIVSNVSGKLVQGGEIFSSKYWHNQIRQPVRFMQSMQTLYEQGYRLFLELGPHPILIGMGNQCLKDPYCVWLPSLRRGYDDWEQMFNTLSKLYVYGVKVDWRGFDRDYIRSNVVLPTYPFKRKRYWMGTVRKLSVTAQSSYKIETIHSSHPLLGRRLRSALKEIQFEKQISPNTIPFPTDYRFCGTAIFPPSGYLEMVVAAVNETLSSKPSVLEDVTIGEPLIVPDNKTRTVQFILKVEDSNKASFHIFSLTEDEAEERESWKLCARGTVRITEKDPVTPAAVSIQEIKNRCQEGLLTKTFYQRFQEMGYNYGPRFQGLRHIWRRDGEALGEIRLEEEQETKTNGYYLSSALLDCCFQLFDVALFDALSQGPKQGHYMPIRLSSMQLHNKPNTKLWGYVLIRESDSLNKENIIGDLRLLNEFGQIVMEVEGLHLKRVSEEVLLQVMQRHLSDWLYEIKWKHKEVLDRGHTAAVSLPAQPGRWIIFGDRGGVGAALCKLLEERGETYSLVFPGEIYERSQDGDWKIAPRHPEDFQRLLAETASGNAAQLRWVVHLWALDAAPLNKINVSSLQDTQTLACGSVLHLVQAMVKSSNPELPRLWLVTRGAQAIESDIDQVAIEQAPLWGLGRTVAVEHAQLWGGLLDLDPAESPYDSALHLLQSISVSGAEDQMMFRGGNLLVARLQPLKLSDTNLQPFRIQIDGSYLITGGLGGIGFETACWLGRNGARYVILVGRTALPKREEWNHVKPDSLIARRIERIQSLENMGMKVEYLNSDAGDEKVFEDLHLQVEKGRIPPVRGIVHAAGVFQYESLASQKIERMLDVMRAKVVGSWLLHEKFLDQPLDFFILFSSFSSLLNSPFLGAYSAANTFLDALARYRRVIGLPALSVSWGTWSQTGMAVEVDYAEDRSPLKGVGTISNREGIKVLEMLLQCGAVHAGVMPIDWEVWRRSHPVFSSAPYLERLMPELTLWKTDGIEISDETGRTGAPQMNLVKQLKKASVGEYEDLVFACIRKNVAKVLNLDLDSPPNIHQKLSEMGMDSLMAVELNKLLQAELGQPLPATLAFEYPTIHDLTQYITREILSIRTVTQSSAASDKGDSTVAHETKDLEQLSDEEAEEALLSALQRTGY
jgi:acyl transferase domain-containing protein/acyl carrier protein